MSLNEILGSVGFEFKKKFGQNFITDSNLLKAIVADAEITQNDTVVEIGAGAGTLTYELSLAADNVIAYEIDRELKPVLTETLRGRDNVELRFCDALAEGDGDFREIGEFKLVANLPYYITTPLLMKFIEGDIPVKTMTVMVQKEVAERMCARAGTPEYGSVTLAVAYFGSARITRVVPRQMFRPVPNVDSAVLVIEKKDRVKPRDEKLFRTLYRSAFAMRRKTLVNNLGAVGIERGAAESALAECGFSADVRGEKLSAEDFIRLSDILSKG